MKKIIFSMVLCVLLILSSCAQRGNESSESTLKLDNLPIKTSSVSQSREDTDIPVEFKQIDWNSIQGKIKGIYPAGGSKVLVFADQMLLYNLATGKMEANAQNPNLNCVRVLTLDKGYAIIGETISERSSGGLVKQDLDQGVRVTIYNQNLILESEVNISELMEDEEFLIDAKAIAVSSDGNCIAFATLKGVTLYDRLNENCTKLIDLTSDDKKAYLGIVAIEQMGFINDGKSLAFKARSFDVSNVVDKRSFDTVGTVNIDGSGLTNEKPDDYSPKMLTSYSSFLLVAEDFKTASGRIMVIDTKTGEQNIHTLSSKTEGGNIYGSDTGRYFASSVFTKTGWTVRIYETKTGKLVKEENISNDGQDFYSINDPMMCVLDNTRTCLVILGHKQDAVDTKIVSISF